MIKVLLLDDHNIFRAGMERMLEKSGQVQVLISTDSGRKAIKMAMQDPPDLAIVDISMPDLDGLECTSRLHTQFPQLPILVLTMHEEAQYALRALEAGAMGFLTKKAAALDLFTAIKTVHQGQRYLPGYVKDSIAMAAADGRNPGNLLSSLSRREFQVLVNLAGGMTNREIADAYHISVKTVDTYRSRILQKLGARNNVELAIFAVKNGLIEA